MRLDQTEILVLDEADHMLDLGFIVPIRKYRAAELPPRFARRCFFSATMPSEISAVWLVTLLHNPVQVAVTPVADHGRSGSSSR